MEEEDEKEFGKYIIKQATWEQLPPHIKKKLENSRDVWRERVVKYSIRHQLRWKTNLVRTFVSDEKGYYTQIVKTSKASFMVSDLF